jgi:uncharacterized Zn finger protein
MTTCRVRHANQNLPNRHTASRNKKGQKTSPVVIDGRTIAKTFWGKAWCENLESYSDYENRLLRGRTYVRNGSVVDLQILEGKITALVSGSSLYKVTISIGLLPNGCWCDIKSRCAGQIGSLVELLQGRLSKGVMAIVTARDDGLFPKPKEIQLSCSCPDWAGMCKHVAAVMYGVGARLDHQPELLFRLRQVDHLELIDSAVPTTAAKAATGKSIAAGDIADVFGIELAPAEATTATVTNETIADSTTPAKRSTRKKASKQTDVGELIPAVESAAKPARSQSAARRKSR